MLKQAIKNIPFNKFIRRYEIKINNTVENIIELHKDVSLIDSLIKMNNEIISVIGQGPQGRGQSLNLRDQGFNVILGLRQGPSFENALKDGWIKDKNLFSIEEAAHRGTFIKYLVSDASQISMWPVIKPNLKENNTLFFSHGFGITQSDKTKIIPPKNIDVLLVAPKGPGIKVREHFLNGSGVNASQAIHHDYSGKAKDKAVSIAKGMGVTNLFYTTFEKEVFSDLTGERCVLLGMIVGAFKAQQDVLVERGHSHSEAFNETVEEALECLYPLMSLKGADWMLSNCSTTAQIGALDWSNKFYDVINQRKKLEKELEIMNSHPMWQVGKDIRKLRPTEAVHGGKSEFS